MTPWAIGFVEGADLRPQKSSGPRPFYKYITRRWHPRYVGFSEGADLRPQKSTPALSFINTYTRAIGSVEGADLRPPPKKKPVPVFYNYIKGRNINKLSIISNTLNFRSEKDFIGHFLHGLKLKSYEFNIYKTKKEKKIILINLIGKKNN